LFSAGLAMSWDRENWLSDWAMELLWFRKPLRGETRLTKNWWDVSNELQVEEYFRKRIEKRSVRLRVSNINSRKLQTFRSSRKVWTFCGKIIQTTNWSLSRKGIENSLSWQLVAASIRISSNPCEATVGITVISSELLSDFRISKV